MSRTPRNAKDFSQEDEAIARYRDALKARFPLPAPTPPKNKRATAKVAGLVLLAIVTGLVWLDPAYQSQHVVSLVGQRQPLQLADGSTVLLDSDSQMTVSWHLRSRQVVLEKGQALFEVSPRVYRPFLIDAGSATVRVVGTRFNVNRNEQDVQVTVLEGKVAVRGTANDAVARLEPGQQLRVRNGIAGQVLQVNVDDVSAWKDSRLVFESTPLADVIATLQRYHPQPIVLMNQHLARLPVSGVFDSDHVERLLALLPGILPVTVSNAADGAVLIKSRDTKK